MEPLHAVDPKPGSRPAPGWYQDPADVSRERFYEPAGWTSYVRPRLDNPRLAHAPDVAASRREPDLSHLPAPARAPHRTAALLDWAGTLLVVFSLVALGYFGWTLVGTNVLASVEQARAREHLAVITPVPAAPVSAPTDVPVVPPAGTDSAHIFIPSIGVDQIVVSGTDKESLARGPGIWEAGVFPGAPGNATISGHRTTHGGPFRHLDELKYGDRIIISAPGRPDAVFEVRGSAVVKPSRIQVTEQTPGVRLTLTTCEPVGSDAARLVVQAELIEGQYADQALPQEGWTVQGG
jgi:sortase A